VDDRLGLAGDLVVGEADDGVAGERQLLITLAVALEGRGHRVIGVAVGLDDETLRGPGEVHQEPGDAGVRGGPREVVVVGELEEQDLQHAPEVCGTHAFEGIKQSPQRRRSVLSWMLVEAPADGEQVEESEAVRVGDRLLHRPGSQMW
jgi:hypothetical protein